VNAYEMCVANTARYIREHRPEVSDASLDAFAAAQVLSIAFCKLQEDVLSDIITFEEKPC